MATIRDVAKVAGVSIGTVSRYLNGIQLKEKNMINIKKAIEELNYEENIIAKGLKNNRSHSIGVVINSLTDIFATSIVSHLENFLEDNNYSLLLCDYQNDLQMLERKIEFLKTRYVDGMVIFHLEKELPKLKEIKEANIPVIAVDSPIGNFVTDTVLVDNYNASYQVTNKLLEFGHKKIGIISGNKNRYIGRKRLEGYVDRMKEESLYQANLVTFGNYSQQSGYEQTKILLKNQELTALYSTNYYMTLGAVQALNEEKINIPDDISLIGFDYFEATDILSPKLTVVVQPVEEIGKKIGEILLDKISNKNNVEISISEIKTKMLWRDTVKAI